MSLSICIPYFSGAGHTAQLAHEIAKGFGHDRARLIDVTRVHDDDWYALDTCHAIVFGSPTYMGSTAAQFNAFLETAAADRWPEPGWADKIAAGFTVANHPSGDKLVALQRIQTYAAQMGMIWVGQTSVGAPVFPEKEGLNSDGSWIGLMATSSRDKTEMLRPQDRQTANAFGLRIANATRRWNNLPSD
ncbi:MAG: flavodoxin family protein [Paracoccaceae bacterium]